MFLPEKKEFFLRFTSVETKNIIILSLLIARCEKHKQIELDIEMVSFGFVRWHINFHGLFNVKAILVEE